MAVRTLLGQSEHLIYYRDAGSGKQLIASNATTGGAGPGGHGSSAITKGWRSTLKRMTQRLEVTATGNQNYQISDGMVSMHDPAALFPLMPPSNLIYRIRQGIAAEYVSGAGVSRVGFGIMKSWSNLLVGAPGAALDLGFIGFLWYQVGSTPVNWRAVAANHAGDNKFDVDTGKVAPDQPYNLRIDFDARPGQRKILWFIDETEVASFTPGDGVLGGTDLGTLIQMGINPQQGNVCAGHTDMLGENVWELLVRGGV
jgi:hypothetical protein